MRRATPGGAGALTLGLESLHYGRHSLRGVRRSKVGTLRRTRPRRAGALTPKRGETLGSAAGATIPAYHRS